MKSMSFAMLLSLMLAGSPAVADDVADKPLAYELSKSRSVSADLNRDGSTDQAELGVGTESVGLRITLDGKLLPVIEIPVDGSKQFGICSGASAKIGISPQSEAPLNALGETPTGYEICPSCVEIDISDGECDSLHFYWDTTTKTIAWWRA